MDGIHVGREPSGRLGAALADEFAHLEAAHRVDRLPGPVGADEPGGLGVDVERVVVARDRQRAVALLVPRGKALRRGWQAVHPDPLHCHTDIAVATLQDLEAVAAEEVVAGRHVVPRQYDGAVELSRVSRPVDDDAGLVGMVAVGHRAGELAVVLQRLQRVDLVHAADGLDVLRHDLVGGLCE